MFIAWLDAKCQVPPVLKSIFIFRTLTPNPDIFYSRYQPIPQWARFLKIETINLATLWISDRTIFQLSISALFFKFLHPPFCYSLKRLSSFQNNSIWWVSIILVFIFHRYQLLMGRRGNGKFFHSNLVHWRMKIEGMKYFWKQNNSGFMITFLPLYWKTFCHPPGFIIWNI